MATIYYDFSAPTNGDGTLPTTPKNTWATPSNGDVIRIKRGCIWLRTSQLNLSTFTSLTFTTYYNDDGSDDVSKPKPIITHSASSTFTWNFQGDGLHLIENLSFFNCSSNTNGAVLGSGLVAATSVYASLKVVNCDFNVISANAIRFSGTGAASAPQAIIQYCTFNNIGEDAIYGGAFYYEVSHCRMTNLSSNSETGDGVGFLGTNPTFAWIHNNYIDHSSRPYKHCIIIDAETANNGFAVIEDNVLIGPTEYGLNNSSIVNGDAVLIIRRNKIYSGRVAINLAGNGSQVYNNYIEILQANSSAPVIAIDADNCLFYNNTIVCKKTLDSATKTLVQASGATNNVIRNNVFYNVPIAIWSDDGTNPTVSNNAFWQVIIHYENAISGIFTGTNDVTSNPQFNSYFIPKSTSPLIETGLFVANGLDLNRKVKNNPPSIGAYEFIAERATAPTRGIR